MELVNKCMAIGNYKLNYTIREFRKSNFGVARPLACNLQGV